MRPMKYSPHIDLSVQALRISDRDAASLMLVRPLEGSSRSRRCSISIDYKMDKGSYVDHDYFLSFGIPGSRTEDALGIGG